MKSKASAETFRIAGSLQRYRQQTDEEAFENLLRDQALRSTFYDKVSAFSRSLKLAMSSVDFHKRRRRRQSTSTGRMQSSSFAPVFCGSTLLDTIDFSEYEAQIQT